MTTLLTATPPWRKLKATNFTDSSFPARKSTLTEPTGAGVIDLTDQDRLGPTENGLIAKFFGTSANNNTFNVRIYGWHKCIVSTGVYSWEHALLADLTCTLGNLAGVAGGSILDTDFEVDTIAEVTVCNVEIVSPANDIRGAHIMLDTKGFSKVEFLFDMVTAASAGALFRQI